MEFKNIDQFNPKFCISGQMNRMNRQIANIFRTYLKPFDITDSQLTILFVLSKRQDLNQKKLSDITILEKSTLNRNLKRLFDKNYISKANLPILTLTLEGKQFVNRVIPEWEKAMKDVRALIHQDGEEALHLLYSKLITQNK